MAGRWVAVPVAGVGRLRKTMEYLSDLQMNETAGKGCEIKEDREKLWVEG